MSIPIPETLQKILEQVLETMAFVFADPWDDETEASAGPWLAVDMSYHGHAEGEVTLLATEACARALRAEVLGVDAEEVTEAEARDTLRELLNVVCGHLLTELYGTTPVFNLDVPRIRAARDGEVLRLMGDGSTAKAMIEGEPILLALRSE